MTWAKDRKTSEQLRAAAIESLERRALLSCYCGVIGPNPHLRGIVFNDLNANGVRDSGEGVLTDWHVKVTTYEDCGGYSPTLDLVTDEQGSIDYEYSPCNFSVTFAMSADVASWRPSATAPIDLHKLDGSPFSLGVTQRALASGVLFNDLNGNGRQDISEAMAPGWRVFVDSNHNRKLDFGEESATTDSQGAWQISDLRAGLYDLHVEPRNGLQQSTPAPDHSLAVTVGNGQVLGNLQLAIHGAQINGRVFNDLDGNGQENGHDAGLEGWRVFSDANNNHKLDASEESALTDSAGDWLLPDLSGGAYNIRLVAQTSWPQTSGSDGFARTLSIGQNLFENAFGVRGVYIGGQTFIDSNGNKIRDTRETDIWSGVYIDANNNRKFDTGEKEIAAFHGTWSFADLPAGHYVVRAFVSEGNSGQWVRTSPSGGAGAYTLDLVPGQSTDVNFAWGEETRIRGTVQSDHGADGLVGLEGWHLFLDNNRNGRADAGEQSTTTDRDGNYTFTHLAPGVHILRLMTGRGFAVLEAEGGANREVATTNYTRTPRVAMFTVQGASITGSFFEDRNGNGLSERGEEPLTSADVYLDLNDNGTYDAREPWTIAIHDGNWGFYDLAPGRYVVRALTAYSRYGISTEPSRVINLAELQHRAKVLFGVYEHVWFSGNVFNDLNGDGIRQDNEPKLDDVEIFLDRNDNGVRDPGERICLSDRGYWRFIDLKPGNFIVRATTWSKWVQTGAKVAFHLFSGERKSSLTIGLHWK